MMHPSSVFGVFFVFIIGRCILEAHAYIQECPKLPYNCIYKRNQEDLPGDVECRGVNFEQLKSLFSTDNLPVFREFQIVSSKLDEVNKTMFSAVPVNELKFKSTEVELFHLFGALTQLLDLRTLIIDHVSVEKWKFASGNGLTALQEFILLDCPSPDDREIVRNLPKHLASITIRWCRVTSEETYFKYFTNLEKLDLRNNRLSALNRGFLPSPATRLKVCQLSDNPIKTIAYGTFSNMPKLETVHLESTDLVNIPYTAVKPVLKQLKAIQLAHNPFNCDCFNSWILTIVLNRKIQIPICTTPESLKDKGFDVLIPTDMCKQEGYEKTMHDYCESTFG